MPVKQAETSSCSREEMVGVLVLVLVLEIYFLQLLKLLQDSQKLQMILKEL